MTENNQQFYIDQFNKKNYDFIHLIENPSDDILFEYSLNENINYFNKINNQTNDMCLKILEKDLKNIKFIKNPTFDQWMFLYNRYKNNKNKSISSEDFENNNSYNTKSTNYNLYGYLNLNSVHEYNFCKMLIYISINAITCINKNILTQELYDYIFKQIIENKKFSLLEYFPKNFFNNDICTYILEQNIENIQYIPVEYHTLELYKQLVAKNYNNIGIVFSAQRFNPGFKENLYNTLEIFVSINEKILLNYDFGNDITFEQFISLNKIGLKQKNPYKDITDKDVWKKILSYRYQLIDKCSIIDEELALIAVQKYYKNYLHIKVYYESVWNHVLSNDGMLLKDCPNKSLKNCSIAYNNNIRSKQYIPLKYQLMFC